MNIPFAGEHLLPGQLGQFFIVLSFAAVLLAMISYFYAAKNDEASASWKRMARISFRIHSLAIGGIIASLFYIIYNHYFEYHYAWAHSSTALPTHYMISCFWEGQEGSFLLWAFWQMILGNILIFTAKKWEDSVMAIICLSQILIGSMLLGVELLGQKIGSSPFILLRNAIEAPIFQRPEYLSLIKDGNGLNPLLQNYWMVIHPPTLFLGFASMVVPFAFAIAGLWQRKFDEWMKPALPWALFAVMILGTGIIMGSFWAYEALNFGGFWAWDPVENASIIPWFTLIAAVHVMLAYKHTGHSYFMALFLVFISFILVLYASFLTRSGILGETSVHAFTDLGMSGQLIFYILIFLGIGTWLMIKNWKQMPKSEKDEQTYSREFWLFIGALLLCIACLQILFTTSIPVYNAIFGTKVAPPINPIQHYNKWQASIAIFIAFISGFAQFLKYKKTEPKKFYISVGVSFVVAAIITAITAIGLKMYTIQYILLVQACLFSVLANARILGDSLKGKSKLAGSAVAHIGFFLMLIGAMIAASKSDVISINRSGYNYGDDFDEKNTRENVLLFKNEPIKMDKYTVTYLGDSTEGPNTFFEVNYKVIDTSENTITEDFTLYPNAQINPKMGLVSSPDTRHYMLHDIYTHVSSVPVKDEAHDDNHEGHSDDEDYKPEMSRMLAMGDTMQWSKGTIRLLGLNKDAIVKDIKLGAGDIAVSAKLELMLYDSTSYICEPIYIIKDAMQFSFPKMQEETGLKISFNSIDPSSGKISLSIREKKDKAKDYIIMKAIMFPYINLLWGGTIIMVIGFLLSIFRRIKDIKHS